VGPEAGEEKMSTSATPGATPAGPLGRLLARAPKGALRFLSVGVTGLAVHTLLFTALFKLAGLGDKASWWIALIVATAITWSLNRRVTFGPSGRGHMAEIVRYTLVTAVAQGISYSVFLGLGSVAPHLPRTIALIVGAGVATIFSYTGQRFFTFAAPKTPAGEPVISDIPVA
jgi:putative flippase GtrA